MSAHSIGDQHTFRSSTTGCAIGDIANISFEFPNFSAQRFEYPASYCGGDTVGPENCRRCHLWFGYSKPPSWFNKAERVVLWFQTGPVCDNHSHCESCNTVWSEHNQVGRIYGIKETQSVITKGCKTIRADPTSSIVCRNCAKDLRDSLENKSRLRLTLGGIRVLRALVGDVSAII